MIENIMKYWTKRIVDIIYIILGVFILVNTTLWATQFNNIVAICMAGVILALFILGIKLLRYLFNKWIVADLNKEDIVIINLHDTVFNISIISLMYYLTIIRYQQSVLIHIFLALFFIFLEFRKWNNWRKEE